VLGPFHYAFVQRGLLEVLLLAVPAGVLGVWIVLRGLAFYSHAAGTAAFPGLVLADGIGFPAPLGAFAAALLFAFGVERLARSRGGGYDSLTALVLVGALASGVILASDVFHSGADVDTLLFGSLLLVGTRDLALAGVATAATLVAVRLLGRRWLATGFDSAGARGLGLRSPLPDAALLVLVALGIVAALSTMGALLATALFVVPAATVRLVTRRLPAWQLGAVALVAAEGAAGLWLSVETNVPPGAGIAVLTGGVFALTAALRAIPALRIAAPAAAALLLLAGCGSTTSNHGRVDVVATTTQIGDWAREVGGANVDVHQILQPNTDPHEYEPRPSDVEAAADAKVVLENGDGLDAWMNKVVSAAGGHSTVVVLGDGVPVRRPGSGDDRVDPHWWHDPRNAIAAVEEIRDALVRADPEHAARYRRDATAYTAELRGLDRGIAACVATVPRAQRKLVTDHDAFGYFAARYGLEVVGAVIPSQTTQAQPSAGETANLIALIRREHVKAVFPESSVNPKLARTIAAETGARATYTLYGDTLGPAGSPGATYLSMERANADAIVRGLTGGAHGCRWSP
jgi:ABC-type Zn uptake system ZnuABC Zn-binding protein ZnuA/ABC-type Mn2+/Zn2+ transport system permease subunit